MLLYVHRNRKLIRDAAGEPRTATSTFTQLLSSETFQQFQVVLSRTVRGKKESDGRTAKLTRKNLTENNIAWRPPLKQ